MFDMISPPDSVANGSLLSVVWFHGFDENQTLVYAYSMVSFDESDYFSQASWSVVYCILVRVPYFLKLPRGLC